MLYSYKGLFRWKQNPCNSKTGLGGPTFLERCIRSCWSCRMGSWPCRASWNSPFSCHLYCGMQAYWGPSSSEQTILVNTVWVVSLWWKYSPCFVCTQNLLRRFLRMKSGGKTSSVVSSINCLCASIAWLETRKSQTLFTLNSSLIFLSSNSVSLSFHCLIF